MVIRVASVLLLVAGVFSSVAHAQFTWTGAINNQWGTGNNWDSTFVPPVGSNVKFGAPNNTSVDLFGNRTVGILSLSATVPFKLSNDILKISTGVQTDGTIVGSHEIASGVDLPSVIPWNITGGAPLLVSGVIDGAGGITKQGLGELTLSAANTFTGDTTINAGKVVIDHADALANSMVVINIDNGLDINGLDAQIGALAGSGEIDLGSQDLQVGYNDTSTTYSGVITGTSDSLLRNRGTGTLTLTGGTIATPSSFGSLRSQAGPIVVDGARIDLTSSSSSAASTALNVNDSPLTLRNGADVRVTTGYTYVQDSTLTITGVGTLLETERFQTSALPASPVEVYVEEGATLVTHEGLTLETSTGGTNTLFVRSGGTVQLAGNLLLARPAGATGIVSVSGSNSSLTAGGIRLGGADNNPGGTGQFTAESGATVDIAGETRFWTAASTLTVDDATVATDTLTNDAGVVATISISDPAGGSALTVGTGDGSSTFDGTIQDASGGPGSLKKVGSGTFTLAGTNTFTGDTDIDGGSIILATANALQNSTVRINFDNGLDVTTNAINAILGGLAGSGDLDLGSQNVAVGSNGASTTYSGVITGSDTSRLRHVGTGTLTLTGGTEGNPSSFGFLWSQNADGSIVIDGAHIDLIGASNLSDPQLRAQTGDISLENGAQVRGLNDGYGRVQDSTLTVAGEGTSLDIFELDALSSGSIVATDGAAITADRFTVAFTSGPATADSQFSSGATLSAGLMVLGGRVSGAVGTALVTGSQSAITANYLLLGGSDISYGGTGLLTVEENATVEVTNRAEFLTSTSSITINRGTLETNLLAEQTGVLGTISISDPTGGTALTVGINNGSSTFNGLIQDAGGFRGSLKKIGTGTLTLTGANTYTGGTILDGGTLSLGNSAAAGTGVITVLGSTIAYADTIDVANAIALQNNVTLQVNSGTATQSGVISETGGSYGISKTGAGNLVLAAANTFTGDTMIDNGVIILANANALQNSTVHINVDNGLDVTTNAIKANLGGLAGSGNLDLGSQNVAVGSNGASTTYSGVITGSDTSRLRHVGTGTLTLTGGTDATPSSFGLLQTETAGGAIIVDGAHIDLNSSNGLPDSPLKLLRGDMTLRNGAQVDTALANGTVAVQDAKLKITGGGTSLSARRSDVFGAASELIVEQGGTLDAFGNSVVRVFDKGSLTVRSGGTVVSNLLSLTPNPYTTPGSATITDSTSALMLNNLNVGGSAGGNGTLTVQNGATATINSNTVFSGTASTLEVLEATLTTNALIQAAGFVGTISLSDPVGDAALTVGTNNGSSTFDGLIQDASAGPGSLKKVGTGTFTLTNNNTYTGDTIVEGGTLSLAQDFLADTADVVLDSAATLNLTHAATDTIAELILGGFSRAVGTHGGIGSGADFEWAQITGTGLLEVTTFSGLAGDYNADGTVNIADYTIWRNNLGAPAGTLVNDPNPGAISSAQYQTWKTNFGNTSPPPGALESTSVPEPCTVALLVLGGLLGLAGSRSLGA